MSTSLVDQPTTLRLARRVKLKGVDLRINLESLPFYLQNVEDGAIQGH